MPSLFSSRRRGSSAQPPVDRNTSSAATAAAGQAFLGRAASTTNLSSAAAAAALRSQTTSPELVGNVQTKRMQRRASTSSAGSVSVIGSGTRGGVGRGGLQRTNSGGSMAERTFRSPSPSRQNSSTAQVQAGKDAPPVPTIPNGHRRSASLDPPQRVMSPTPGTGKRGSSVDRASMPAEKTPKSAKRLSNVNEEQVSTDEAPSSPLRNFSRPMSKDGNSTGAVATKSKYTHGQGSWFTQTSGAPETEARNRPFSSAGTSSASASGIGSSITNPKKKRISSAPGSHLSQATRNSVATPGSDETDSVMVFDPNTRTFITRRRASVDEPSSPVKSRNDQVYDPNTRSFIPRQQAEAEDIPQTARTAPASKKAKPSISSLETNLQPPPKNPARYSPSSESPSSPRAMGFLLKQPSVVREDREGEEVAEASQPTAKQSAAASQRSVTSQAKSYTAVTPKSHARSSSLDVPRGEQAQRGRNASLSPSRSTRFSPSPVMDSTIHNPPGRDVSPVKSAMKHSPASSVRGHSPRVVAGPASESDAMSDVGSQDGLTPKRKKSARVSFDEHAQVVPSAPPVLPNPVDEDPSDDDGAMKPRPALPSFGSVRSQRMSPEPAEKVTEMYPERDGSSTDAALGGILAGSLRGEGKKVERESSPQDPLPPEVTSREMADYASDTSSEANVPAPTHNGDVNAPAARDFAVSTTEAEPESAKLNGTNVPDIALQPPTPGVEDDSKKDLQEADEVDEETKRASRLSRDLSMPGGWGNDDDEETAQRPEASSETTPLEPRRSSSEDSAATQTVTPIQPVTSEQTPSYELSDISEDSDDSAAFSDAAEDLSDLEDGGFASLDAIVESPMVVSTPQTKKGNLEAVDEADSSPTLKTALGRAMAEENDKGSGDWREATAYWSNLSKQQREQIEREHMSDDEEPRPAPTKTKKKQPATAAASLKPALKQQSAQQQSAQQQSAQQRSAQQPAQASGMRKSMRAQSGPAPAADEGGVHMRRSMRSGGSGGGGMMSTMRDGPQSRQRPQSEHYPEPRGALQKRPMSSGGAPASAGGTAMRQSMRPGSSDSASRPLPLDSAYPPLPNKRASQQAQTQTKKGDPPVVSARLQKELAKADDSDSESSFRKQRRRNRAGSVSTMDSRGGYSIRKSMRGGEREPAAPPPRPASPDVPRSSKWSMRSLSPTGSLFGRNKMPARASVDAGPRTTLRSQQQPGRSSSAQPSKSRPSTASAAAPSSASRFKSRFAADSDDEDDARPAKTFRSRFADSDDEDDAPANLTPVRGIPKRKGQEDGDSTDLDEEDDDDPRKKSRQRKKQPIPGVPDPSDVEKAMAAARRNLGMEEGKSDGADATQGNALQQGSLRKKQPASATPEASPQVSKTAPAQTLQEKKKRSFMGSILRRNRNSQTSVPQVAASPAATPASPAAAITSPLAPADPATPSTPSSPTANKLRRTSYQNQPVVSRPRRGDSDLSTATAPEASRDAGNWPLASPSAPPVPKIPGHLSRNAATPVPGSPASPEGYFGDAKEEQTPTPTRPARPTASGGVAGTGNEIRIPKTLRPSGLQRSASEQVSQRSRSGGHVSFVAGDEGSEPGERPEDFAGGKGVGAPVYSRKTGRKKKFGRLRRAFGLDD